MALLDRNDRQVNQLLRRPLCVFQAPFMDPFERGASAYRRRFRSLAGQDRLPGRAELLAASRAVADLGHGELVQRSLLALVRADLVSHEEGSTQAPWERCRGLTKVSD